MSHPRRWRILHFAWVAFCCTFVAWFAFPPVAAMVQGELGLTDAELGWLFTAGVALTIPGRIWIGALVDRFGPRRTFSVLLAVMSVPVALLGVVESFEAALALRLVIGLVGCGFVIGIRLISDWFPAGERGLAAGVYGGWGNAGSAVAALGLPLLADALGWRGALALSAVPMALWSIVFWRFVRDVPPGRVYQRTPREVKPGLLRDRRVRILCLAYFATFGSEIAVVSFLPKFFHDRFELSLISAGACAALFGAMNLVARPMGGWLADRFGGREVIVVTVGLMGLGYLAISAAPSLLLAILAVGVASLLVQAGEGAVFAAVPGVAPTCTGQVAGLVGASGNVGALLFPLAFGYGLQLTGGSYVPGFLVLAVVAGGASLVALQLRLDPQRRSDAATDRPLGPVRMVPAVDTP